MKRQPKSPANTAEVADTAVVPGSEHLEPSTEPVVTARPARRVRAPKVAVALPALAAEPAVAESSASTELPSPSPTDATSTLRELSLRGEPDTDTPEPADFPEDEFDAPFRRATVYTSPKRPLATAADITARVKRATLAALDRQAVDLRVLRLADVTDFTDYFLIAGGTNERQVQAIAEAIEAGVHELGVRVLHREGVLAGQWVLLDFGDFVVHVMSEDRRSFYALERLWSDAPDVTAQFVA